MAELAGGRGAALELAASGGEDYELLVALPPERLADAPRGGGARRARQLTEIGYVAEGRGRGPEAAGRRRDPAARLRPEARVPLRLGLSRLGRVLGLRRLVPSGTSPSAASRLRLARAWRRTEISPSTGDLAGGPLRAWRPSATIATPARRPGSRAAPARRRSGRRRASAAGRARRPRRHRSGPARFATSATSGSSAEQERAPRRADGPARPGRSEEPGLQAERDQQRQIGIHDPDAERGQAGEQHGRRGGRSAAAPGGGGRRGRMKNAIAQ